MAKPAAQRRTCRCCGETYTYPERGSLATRTYCGNCVRVPVQSRRAIERLRRRVERLAETLERASP